MRKVCCHIIILMGAFLLATDGFSQLTKNDFKLSLDTFSTFGKSNMIRITKAQLLKSKELHTNFSWAHITSFIALFNSNVGTNCTTSAGGNGNKFNDASLLPLLKRAQPGTSIVIVPHVVNNQNKEVEWSELFIIIIE